MTSTGVEFYTLLPLIGFSMFMFLLCMTWFGFAVKSEMNRLFAPRSWGRPTEIIKNQLKKPYCLSWIPWALNLSYSQMLEGIEGTGTRNKGRSGTKLRCNLDGIILIKFVNLCLKVAVLATILCVGIVLPINYTAKCVPEAYENINEGNEVCQNLTQLTTFEKTTMANIPELVYTTNSTWYSEDLFQNPFGPSTGISLRMITTVLVSFAIYTYTCVLIWEEWIQNLALRRVYYLELNHYERRKEELERIDNLTDPEDINTTDRPVFVVHPELRDTVPNIGLYSVLFRLPGVQSDEMSCATNSDVGRQLQLAIDFFDKVVPNQPGFSSSIAALTILPDVKRLSQAWKKWFACAGKVRRLKFIRQRIKQLQAEQNLTNSDVVSQQKNTDDTGANASQRSYGNHASTELESLETSNIYLPEGGVVSNSDTTDDVSNHAADQADGFQSSRRPRRSRITCIDGDLEAARSAASIEIKEESNMEMFLDDDEIEQMTVYYREFARSSASCGPYGCDEYTILKADAVTLADLEQEAEEEVSLAIEELQQARIEIREDEPNNLSRLPRIQEIQSDLFSMEEGGVGDLNEGTTSNVQLDQNEATDECTETELPKNTLNLWEEAEKLVGSEQYMVKLGGQVLKRKLNTGRWFNPFEKSISSKQCTTRRVVENVIPSGVLSRIIKSESYAVVTFTSRQAAIAARQCLSDGSGLEGWREVDKIPIPPLADAVPWNIFDCRGCCRPVTVTLPPEQRRVRFKIVVVVMIAFSLIWTYPFYLFSNMTSTAELEKAFVDVPHIKEYAKYLSPWLSSGIMIAFFAILPQIFKMLANFAGEATSIQEAERHALIYYWWFMLVFVFGGKTLGNLILTVFINNDASITSATQLLSDLAKVVPTTQSFYWITWMISQTGIILPFMYFLQFNNFMFTSLKWDCCARATAGGGPGGIVPYRVYVNSSVIFLCVVALAPLCPMVAPFSMLCFLFITPLLKWGHIFVYRPTFDAGGMRWPLLHNILMISIIVSQILLAISFFLKKAFLVAIICTFSLIPTWTFKSVCKDTFEQSYNDAALLQTSELDGWNVQEETSMTERERYRKWVVDCHKASYVPVCVNAEDNFLTSEPAVVIPTERDQDIDPFHPRPPVNSHDSPDQSSGSSPLTCGRQRTSTLDSHNSKSNRSQRGALFRRVMGSTMLHIPVGDYNSIISEECASRGSSISFPQQFVETKVDNNLNEESREKSL